MPATRPQQRSAGRWRNMEKGTEAMRQLRSPGVRRKGSRGRRRNPEVRRKGSRGCRGLGCPRGTLLCCSAFQAKTTTACRGVFWAAKWLGVGTVSIGVAGYGDGCVARGGDSVCWDCRGMVMAMWLGVGTVSAGIAGYGDAGNRLENTTSRRYCFQTLLLRFLLSVICIWEIQALLLNCRKS